MMKQRLILIGLIASASFVWSQTPAPSPAPCSKNVTFAVAEGGQPVPAIPKFALKWIGSKAPRERYSNICFSQMPSASLHSYVIVFSTTEAAFEGLTASAHTYTTASPGHANTATLNSSGGTWAYAYSGAMPPVTTDTLSLKRDDKPKVLDVRAYDQTGRVVSRYNLTAFSSREKLLERVLSDIAADLPAPTSRASVVSPFPVYYVNCDVDAPQASPPVSSFPPPPRTETASVAPKPAPPTDPQLEIWSNPGGADIFLDGGYVGRTPYSLSVPQGEHVISLRKKDFGVWQRKVLVTAGKRRIGAYLEQKVLNLQ